jgi:hypothetical protein
MSSALDIAAAKRDCGRRAADNHPSDLACGQVDCLKVDPTAHSDCAALFLAVDDEGLGERDVL